MRLFVSIDLPDAVADALADVQASLRDAGGLTFVVPTKAHVTLKFLGDVADERVPEVVEAIETAVDVAGVDPFETTVAGLGVFPSLDFIRVVWAGVEAGAAEMTTLHEALDAELAKIGFDPEAHEFTPHVTIARMNDARGKQHVVDAVQGDQQRFGRFHVDEIRLTESRLAPTAPEYSTVAQFSL